MSEQDAFLSTLGAADRDALGKRWSKRKFVRNETIVAHDEESSDIFFVLEGRARATVFSEDGRTVSYRDIGPGGIFGELAAIDGKARSATVVALEAVHAAKLTQTAFRELVGSRPAFAWALLNHLSKQIRRLSERVYEFSNLAVRGRLVRELLRLAEGGDQSGNGVSIVPAPTHFELSARISTHREAVSREMSALAKKRLIVKRSGALVLLDVAALRELAADDG
jgi:CRP/FNR family transcriptional regulator, cyclic AMP receptor protein